MKVKYYFITEENDVSYRSTDVDALKIKLKELRDFEIKEHPNNPELRLEYQIGCIYDS
jgi:hypothetical protein